MSGTVPGKLASIRAKAVLTGNDVAAIVGASPETVSRWKTARTRPQAQPGQALRDLECIVDQLAELYERHEIRPFLFSPQLLLPGVVSPAKLIRAGHGDDVIRLLLRLRERAQATSPSAHPTP